MRFIDSGFDNILLDEKSCKNLLILNILWAKNYDVFDVGK